MSDKNLTASLGGPGVLEMVKSITEMVIVFARTAESLGRAAEAYARITVCELKILEDPDVAAIRKEVALMECRDKKSGLDKKRARLERTVTDLERRAGEAKSRLEARGHQGVQQDLKEGMRAAPYRGRGPRGPLTHRMDIPPAQTNEARLATEEQPLSEAKAE